MLKDDTQTSSTPITILIGPCLSVVLAALGTSLAAVTLPTLTHEFSDARVDATLVVSMYILATTVLIVPIGRMGDLFGKRNVLLVGLAVYILGALLAAYATSLSILVTARFIQGAGASAMLAMPMAQVRDVVLPDHVGRWMGAMGTMSAIGTASGPAIGGAITASFSWQSAYLLLVPFAAAAIILSLLFNTDEQRPDRRPAFDVIGALTLAASLTFLTLFISNLTSGLDVVSVLLFALAVVSFVGFLWVEARASAPIIPLQAHQSRHLKVHLAMNTMVSMVMMGILVVGPFFLTGGLGLTTVQMGIAMSVGPISAASGGIPAGRLTEGLGAARAVIFGSLAITVGAGAMSIMPYLFGLAGFITAFIILAPGYQLFLAAVNTSVMSQTPEGDRGVTSGLLNLSRNLGFILGASLMSTVFWTIEQALDNSQHDGSNFTTAMVGTFFIASMLGASTAFLAVMANRER